MDAAILEKLIAFMPADTQEEARAALAAGEQVGQMPLADSQIQNVVGHRRTGAELQRSQSRLARALESLQASQMGLGAMMQPRGVPSRWGQILVKRSPIEKLIAGLDVGVSAYQKRGADAAVTGNLDAMAGQLGKFLGGAEEPFLRAEAMRLAEEIRRRRGVPALPEMFPDPNAGGR